MIKKGKNLMVLTALILLSVLILRWRVYAESEKQDAGNEIIAFGNLEKTEYVYNQKPDARQLESVFPAEVEITLRNQRKENITVSWKAEHDLATTDYDQYIFHAVIDEKWYVGEEVEMPQIKVTICREKERRPLAKAATYKLVEKSTKYNNGLLRVGYFVVQTKEGRKHAFCAQHQLDAPEVNDVMTETTVYTKKTDRNSELSRRIRKVLYYGWGGPADIGPKPDTSGGKGQDKGLKNDASHFRRTALAVSVANKNSDNTFGYGELFLKHLDKNYPDAPDGFEVHMLKAPRKDNQNLVFYRYKPKGKLKITKTSGNPEMSDGNACYSFKGAQFGVYSKYNSGNQSVSGEVGKLMIDEKGKSNTIPVDAGTYYVKELKAPPGFSLSTEVKSVKVSAGATATVEFSDRPQYAPVQILLKKEEEEAKQTDFAIMTTLKNAEFTVLFYPGLWEEGKDPETLGKEPLRKWRFSTDAEGIVKYQEAYRTGGDALYKNQENKPVLPLGTVTIQETKPPEGYLINPKLFVVQIRPEGNKEIVNTYNCPVILEKPLSLELVKWQEGTKTVIPGVEFEYTNPDGQTEMITTGQDGKLYMKGLQHGTHRLKECSVMDGYLLNGNVISFEVDKENQITFTSKIEPEKGEIRVTVTDEGQIRVEVEDKTSPFGLKVHKKNEEGKNLSGAEFGLYSDKECRNIVCKALTNEEGILFMEELEVGKTYYLQETKAPKGYRLPVDGSGNPVVYEIRTESIPTENVFTFYVNGEAYNSSSEGMFGVEGTKAKRQATMIIKNVSMKQLPKTGSWWMLPLMILGMVLSILPYRRR